MQETIRLLALACVCSFSLHLAMAQQPAAATQQAAAAVAAEPEAPRVVLQAESTASVLRLMKFSGALRDRAGNPRTGAVGLTFALYKDQHGGSPLWLEVHNAQLDEQSRYTVLLGSTKSEGLPLELFSSGEARWLGVQLNLPGEEEQPRVLLVSVPYALKAADAETLGGKPLSAFVLAEKPEGREAAGAKGEPGREAVKEGPGREQVVGTITGEGTTNKVAKFTGANTIGDGSIFDNGNVGIATTSPNAKLSVGNGTIADINVPVQIAPQPGSIANYFGATKGGGSYGLLVGYDFQGGPWPVGGVVRTLTDPLTFVVGNEVMRLDGAHVGILSGSEGPKARLSVGQGSIADPNVPVQISTGFTGGPIGAYYGVNKVGGYGLLLGLETGGGGLPMGGIIRMVPPDPLMFFVSNTTEAMRIDPAGFVGIGTAAPTEKLDVAGNVKASNLTLSGSINGGLRVQTTAGTPNVIGGFSGNSVSGGVVGATISGGGASSFANSVTQNFGTVGGGSNNTASNFAASVGGGQGNTASGNSATVGGGSGHTASNFNATVGGGQSNTASGPIATVGGGASNTASGSEATVGGGDSNTASGGLATVPGGSLNTALGNFSFAAGRRAKANHAGAFVWGDGSDFDVASTAVNEFTARAVGGARFISAIDGAGAATAGVSLAAGASAWTTLSDRHSKENFAEVDGRALLARLARIPVLTWNWRAQSASVRHMGPMAQDFRAAFGLGEDDKHISTVDADGVALAAIQALHQLSLEKDRKIEELAREVRELRSLVQRTIERRQ